MYAVKRKAAAAALVSLAILSAFAAPAAGAGTVHSGEPALRHATAPTRYVDVDGNRLAYRRFGKAGGVPLVFFQHFVGTMDSWDPQVVDGLAAGREVILFDNAGVAVSGGKVPTTIEGMARCAIGLLQALDVRQADLLGSSMGSLVAQQVALERPALAPLPDAQRIVYPDSNHGAIYQYPRTFLAQATPFLDRTE